MTIDDDMLSAFLDAELKEDEMEEIRQALVDDEALAERLAELALVDQLVYDAYRRIDQLPLPTMAASPLAGGTPPNVNILPFPRASRRPSRWQSTPAIAAALLLAVGLTLMIPWHGENHSLNARIAEALEVTPSGYERTIAEGVVLKPRLTFLDHQGNYCRQYQLRESDGTSDAIACRPHGKWELQSVERSDNSVTGGVGEYSTASGPKELDDELDRMMAGAPLNAAAEAQAISSGWRGASEK